jgi:hypothetical protein
MSTKKQAWYTDAVLAFFTHHTLDGTTRYVGSIIAGNETTPFLLRQKIAKPSQSMQRGVLLRGTATVAVFPPWSDQKIVTRNCRS